jgi:hypothetical protein
MTLVLILKNIIWASIFWSYFRPFASMKGIWSVRIVPRCYAEEFEEVNVPSIKAKTYILVYRVIHQQLSWASRPYMFKEDVVWALTYINGLLLSHPSTFVEPPKAIYVKIRCGTKNHNKPSHWNNKIITVLTWFRKGRDIRLPQKWKSACTEKMKQVMKKLSLGLLCERFWQGGHNRA